MWQDIAFEDNAMVYMSQDIAFEDEIVSLSSRAMCPFNPFMHDEISRP